MAVLGVISALVMPRLERGLDAMRLKQSAATTLLLLREARAAAVRGQRITSVRAGTDGRHLVSATGEEVALPAQLRIMDGDNAAIFFYPDGSARAAQLQLSASRQQLRLAIDAETGRAQLVTP